MKYGAHRFVAALLLNIRFLIALALPGDYHLDHVHTSAWAQARAWLIGSALTIAYTCVMWLARGRTAKPQPAGDILPGDTRPVPLTRPVLMFAVIRAIAVSIGVAIALGLDVPYAEWTPVATLVAMRASLEKSTLFAEQRLAGAIIGAAVAAVFLLTIDNETAVEVIIVGLGGLAASIRAMNYALYCAAVAGAILIALDLPHPASLADEGRRILFTFLGVGIAVVVMFLRSTPKARGQAGLAVTVINPSCAN